MKIGIVLKNLGIDQTSFLAISYCNSILVNGIEKDLSLFYTQYVTPVVRPLVAQFTIDKVYDFMGTLIATDIYTASLILNTKARKVLFINDLEWINKPSNFLANINILKNPDFTLVCRSKSHADVIQNYCGRTAQIVDNFNLIKIMEILNDKRE
jgi:hypothetical protein